MLSVKAAAARAGVSEGLVRRWVAAGLLPHFRLGSPGKRGKIGIAPEDLDALLASFKVGKRDLEPTPAPSPPRSSFKHLRLN
jgi:hypothetical protein